MGNMSYVRFQNTYNDLQDCDEHLHDDLDEDEARYRRLLIKLCMQIVEDGSDYLDES